MRLLRAAPKHARSLRTEVIEDDMLDGSHANRHRGPRASRSVVERQANDSVDVAGSLSSLRQYGRFFLIAMCSQGHRAHFPEAACPANREASQRVSANFQREKLLLTFFVPGLSPTGAPVACDVGNGSVDAAAAAQRWIRYAGRPIEWFPAPVSYSPTPFGLQRTPQYGSRCEQGPKGPVDPDSPW